MTVYAIHENPDWFPPFAAAFERAGRRLREWLLIEGCARPRRRSARGRLLEPASAPRPTPAATSSPRTTPAPCSTGWRRTAAVSSTGARSSRWRSARSASCTALKAFGIDVPRTIAVIGKDDLVDAAHADADAVHHQAQPGRQGPRRPPLRRPGIVSGPTSRSDEFEEPVDGITLLQEYVSRASRSSRGSRPSGYEYVYAITADTARGGFQLCPADACELDEFGQPKAAESLFALREGLPRADASTSSWGSPASTGSRWPASSSSRPPTADW